MVAPISNDKFPPSSNSKAGGSDTKNSASANKNGAEVNTAADSSIRKPADDTVNIDRASQLYQSATSEQTKSTGNINTAEEAAQLATRISKQLVADGAQAMQAQAGGLTNQVGTLLSAAP